MKVTKHPDDPAAMIYCRPHPATHVFASGFLFLFALCFVWLILRTPNRPTTLTDWLIASGFTALMFAVSGRAAFTLFCQGIGADNEGVWWRHGGARWSEVADYYEIPAPPNQNRTRKPTLVIELRDGRKRKAPGEWTNRDSFRALVSEKATTAKVKAWGLKGARPEDDWPRVFDYHAKKNKWGVPLSLTALIGVCLFLLILAGRNGLRYAQDVGWQGGAAYFLVGALVLLAKPSLGLYLVRTAQTDIQRRRDQRLVISENGMLFTERERRIAATWSEITDYYYQTHGGFIPTFTVETRNGTFDFTSALEDCPVVTTLIARNAAVGDGKWRSRDNDTKTLFAAAPGVTAHHYRTTQNRALLWLLSSLMLAFPLSLLLQYTFALTGIKEPGTFITIFSVFFFSVVYGWAGYFHSRIEYDAAGITQVTAFGKRRHLLWDEVISARLASQDTNSNSSPVGVLSGKTMRLRYGFNLSSLDDLHREIERHIKPVG